MQGSQAHLTPIIGEAPVFLEMLEHVSRAAPMAKPVLVIGERGTGKELIASRLHFLSARWDQPLVKLNCASLTESLLESELFGHEAGAFTGATRQHVGRFERADGGTLFLDELATIPLRMQEKILRVIEYGEFERVGGSDTIAVDVRIVGATNENLPALAKRGRFRSDLLDRLAFDVINVPPLRLRREDVLALADTFALNITSELGRAFFPGFTPAARETLLAHPWPGNVRELKNVVERSVYRWEQHDEAVDVIHIDPFATAFPLMAPAGEEPSAMDVAVEVPPPAPRRNPATPVDLKAEVARLEIELIDLAMRHCRYNQRQTAEHLGLTYHQLRAALRKHDLVDRYGRGRRAERREGVTP